jgi:hypothetical protein
MKTKNLIFLISIVLTTTFTNAQLQVRNDGSVWTGYTGYSNIEMGYSNTVSGGTTYTSGKWAFEVWGENLNIWKPWPSANNGDVNYYMFLTPAGGVGIGKVPTHSGICLDVNGHVYANNYMLTSDERLKKDIKPLTEQLDKLYLLSGKSYKKESVEEVLTLPDIKDEKGNTIKKFEKTKNKKTNEDLEFGFLAQELKQIYPELVNQDTLGYYYVNYIGLIPVLVEAVKEQKAQINALTSLLNKSNSGTMKVGANTTNEITETEIDALTYPVLYQNVPNPFNSTTTIGFSLPTSVGSAIVYVYDMNGTQLKSYPISERGKGTITIQGSVFSAGMYLYALIADGKVIDTKRMILTK